MDDRDLEALSERLGFPDGAPMDDDTREERLAEAAAGGRAPDLGLAWEGGGVTPIGFILEAELPARLGFVRTPAPTPTPASAPDP